MIRMGIAGVSGRMGRLLVAEICQTEDVCLGGALASPTSSLLGADAGELLEGKKKSLGVRIETDPRRVFEAIDVLIDFSVPHAAVQHVLLAQQYGCGLVLGTTGLGKETFDHLKDAAQKIPLVQAANTSVSIVLLHALVEHIAYCLDSRYDVEILETHHRHKRDAPSGTALALGQSVAKGRGHALEDLAVLTRQGEVGPRPVGAIGFACLRAAETVGEHTVMFAGAEDRLELTHRAFNRRIYAQGAVCAARWVVQQPAGLYSMQDVLGLSFFSKK